MMQLSHYPAALAEALAVRAASPTGEGIAQAAQRANEIDSQLMAMQHQIKRFEGNADRVAAFEMDLKNDAQRKARRFEVLLVNQEYQKAIDIQIQLTFDKGNA